MPSRLLALVSVFPLHYHIYTLHSTMSSRHRYMLLNAIRILIIILTLACFIVVLLGKKFNKVLTLSAAISLPDQVKEGFFQDSAHIAINILVFVITIVVLYRRNAEHSWITSWFRRNAISMILILLGLIFSIRSIISITSHSEGCSNPAFYSTASRCKVQIGVCAAELLWTILIMAEANVAVERRLDQKAKDKDVPKEIRGPSLYKPTVSLAAVEQGAMAGIRGGEITRFDSIELAPLMRENEPSPEYGVDENIDERDRHLPEYAGDMLIDRPRVAISTRPPQVLTSAPTHNLNAEGSVERTTVSLMTQEAEVPGAVSISSLPPTYRQ